MSETISTCPKCGAAIPPEAPQGLCPKCLLAQASIATEAGPTTGRIRPIPPSREQLAAAFPNLEILELIGQGGMGFVFKTRQPKLDRVVALKILALPVEGELNFAERFTREGRMLARLNHPNIVTIHDFGVAGPFYYLLMEYVDGVNLRQAMKAGSVAPDQALAIVPKICEALQYAHNEGVLHRDIKPDNILLDARGRVKIADFGIAKLMAESAVDNPLTGSGSALGTPHYMAPEQIEKPNAVDHRADIYSLGVVFYEMLTGELPLGRFAAPSETAKTDPRLDHVVFQTLEKQPERRPQSADEVRTRVEDIATHPKAAGEAPVTFKMARCFISTPEFLQSWLGRLFRFTGKGELRLDEDQLTFAPRGNWIVMPLRAITGVTVGEFPGWMGKPIAALKFIAVTFTEKGTSHRVFLIPNHGGFRSVWKTNEDVEEWFTAIRYAAKTKTGRTPPSSPDDLKPLPGAPINAYSKADFAKAIFILASIALFFGIGLWFRDQIITSRTPATRVEPARLIQATPGAKKSSVPAIPSGPSRTIKFTKIKRNLHTVTFETNFDLKANEQIIPMIRYGEAPWAVDEQATKSWFFTSALASSNEAAIRYAWKLPESFTPDFDVASAVQASRDYLNEPISIYQDTINPILTVKNAAGQTMAIGLKYLPTPPVTPDPNAAAIWKCDRASGSQNENSGLVLEGKIELPPGTFVEAYSLVTGDLSMHSQLVFDPDSGKLAVQFLGGNWRSALWTAAQDLRGKEFELRLNGRTEIFTARLEPDASEGRLTVKSIKGYLELKKLPERNEK